MDDRQQPAAASKPQDQEPTELSALSLRAMPLYAVFFMWFLGTGAQQLARPLYAHSLGASVFFVTLISASNSLSWLPTAPITGLLTDKFGRKPLLMVGNLLRGVTMTLQYFTTSYWQFFLLEFVGGIGVAMWVTGTSVVMADITGRENRGRAVAIRTVTQRVGAIIGPVIGGMIANAFQLRSVFLFAAATKIIIHLILVFQVRETRQDETRSSPGQQSAPAEPLNIRIFFTKAFLAVSFVTFTLSMVGGGGIFGAIFPIHAKTTAGLSTADIGTMMGVAAMASLLISYPNGVVADRFGRKKSLIPGLLVLAVASYLLIGISDFTSVILMIIVYGLGEGMVMGSSEVYAMDLAPARGRGTFLGVWSTFRNVGGIIAPLLVGVVAEKLGFTAAFAVAGVAVVFGALFFGVLGPETAVARAQRQAPQASQPVKSPTQ